MLSCMLLHQRATKTAPTSLPSFESRRPSPSPQPVPACCSSATPLAYSKPQILLLTSTLILCSLPQTPQRLYLSAPTSDAIFVDVTWSGDALVIADSSNNRIRWLNLQTMQVNGVSFALWAASVLKRADNSTGARRKVGTLSDPFSLSLSRVRALSLSLARALSWRASAGEHAVGPAHQGQHVCLRHLAAIWLLHRRSCECCGKFVCCVKLVQVDRCREASAANTLCMSYQCTIMLDLRTAADGTLPIFPLHSRRRSAVAGICQCGRKEAVGPESECMPVDWDINSLTPTLLCQVTIGLSAVYTLFTGVVVRVSASQCWLLSVIPCVCVCLCACVRVCIRVSGVQHRGSLLPCLPCSANRSATNAPALLLDPASEINPERKAHEPCLSKNILCPQRIAYLVHHAGRAPAAVRAIEEGVHQLLRPFA